MAHIGKWNIHELYDNLKLLEKQLLDFIFKSTQGEFRRNNMNVKQAGRVRRISLLKEHQETIVDQKSKHYFGVFKSRIMAFLNI